MKNIAGFMIGRAALENPDSFIEINRSLNEESASLRGLKVIGEEFEQLCTKHMPKPIYLEKIKKYCSWYPKQLVIPVTNLGVKSPRYY